MLQILLNNEIRGTWCFSHFDENWCSVELQGGLIYMDSKIVLLNWHNIVCLDHIHLIATLYTSSVQIGTILQEFRMTDCLWLNSAVLNVHTGVSV